MTLTKPAFIRDEEDLLDTVYYYVRYWIFDHLIDINEEKGDNLLGTYEVLETTFGEPLETLDGSRITVLDNSQYQLTPDAILKYEIKHESFPVTVVVAFGDNPEVIDNQEATALTTNLLIFAIIADPQDGNVAKIKARYNRVFREIVNDRLSKKFTTSEVTNVRSLLVETDDGRLSEVAGVSFQITIA